APPRASRRSSEALAFEPRVYGLLSGMRAELRPSLRVELSQARIGDPERSSPETSSNAVAPTFRIAGLLAPLPALAFSASAASGKRLPSLFELFGDRAFVVASPELQPERSRTIDAGVNLARRAGLLRGQAELRGFVLWIDDLIRYERTAQLSLRAANAARARIEGLELGLDGELGEHLRLSAALNAQRSENQLGRSLALQPGFELYVRPELAFSLASRERATLFVEVQQVGLIYLEDSKNSTSLPPRAAFGFGASVELVQGLLLLQARVRNAFDTLARDVLSRPLPGREILFSLALRETYRW
ncbi:MAG TPA: TonB-dependent receptor, partial [Polyangiales bacterium]|nr:TonB-dependent receptor [Polyangiales bacterium]